MATSGSNSGGSDKKSTTTSLTLKQGTNSLSGYMVASGEGAMACNIDGVIVEGDYQGSEGDPCSAQISVQ